MAIEQIYGYCTAAGATFSPRQAAEIMGKPFDKSIEPGDVLNTGRWKGQPKEADDGYARLNFDLVSKEQPTECRWELTLETIRQFVAACRMAAATDLSVVVVVAYAGQCNLELDATRLRELADLGVSMGLTCYCTGEGVATSVG